MPDAAPDRRQTPPWTLVVAVFAGVAAAQAVTAADLLGGGFWPRTVAGALAVVLTALLLPRVLPRGRGG